MNFRKMRRNESELGMDVELWMKHVVGGRGCSRSSLRSRLGGDGDGLGGGVWSTLLLAVTALFDSLLSFVSIIAVNEDIIFVVITGIISTFVFVFFGRFNFNRGWIHIGRCCQF